MLASLGTSWYWASPETSSPETGAGRMPGGGGVGESSDGGCSNPFPCLVGLLKGAKHFQP